MKINKKTVLASALLMATAAVQAEDVEVLHWWTAGGEAAALSVLKDDLSKDGVGWVDMPVAGGGGGSAMTTLRARVTAGNSPTAVQMLGYDIQDWAAEGELANLNDIAAANNWDAVVPTALQKFSKYDGNWIAAPVNMHSTNWVWANKKVLDDLGLPQPHSWDDFVAAMQAAKDAGKIGLAHGGQPWQEATMFDGVVLSVGGADFYNKAFVELDEDALTGPQMLEAFKRMETLRSFVDDNFSGRDWNLASSMVINGDAAFQIMGDWAKGEFINAGKVPNEDFLCFRVPGSQGTMAFNADQFAMFKVDSASAQEAQGKMAAAIVAPTFQIAFNQVKGSVPSRTDIDPKQFDACGQKGIADLQYANATGGLVGSMAHGHAQPAAIKNAVFDVVTNHFNGEFDAEEAVEELFNAIDAAK
ncbi:sugar ABC transporter substrate-binding protein [Marinomonas ushuaiensis DSM 15871]|uniref:Probable sugar-binding periplasmic protein n=1 Tax=Marinomonas ushuaiensis DSM 15871 TaxID=1122207 RepID=X7E1X4_9GAMM|nr:ABC transporter substrate-binding protein [Marinomonas ushuaiensis]ETX10069.1 sugar ABC transporter substrate-binding protein [Marinomonas ushuaiensis DSM 15871]